MEFYFFMIMNEIKCAVIIDFRPIRAQKVKEKLKEIYEKIEIPERHQLNHITHYLKQRVDSIGLIVVGNCGHLEEVLEQHRGYAIPTIVRLDSDLPLKPEIAHKGNHGYYRFCTMIDIEQDVQKWREYIAEAQDRVKPLRK